MILRRMIKSLASWDPVIFFHVIAMIMIIQAKRMRNALVIFHPIALQWVHSFTLALAHRLPSSLVHYWHNLPLYPLLQLLSNPPRHDLSYMHS